MREGSKAVWNFSENPSVLEAPPDPNDNDTHPKKSVCGSAAKGAVFDLSLLGKVFSWVHWRRHLWCRQEGWSGEFDQLFFSWSTNPPSLQCRRISWWGWRTTTCRPPFWSRSPWWWCGATLNMVDTVRQWRYETFKLVLYDALEVHFWHSRDLIGSSKSIGISRDPMGSQRISRDLKISHGISQDLIGSQRIS